MAKTTVVIYLAVGLFLLLLLASNSPQRPTRNHRRLKLRSNFTAIPTTPSGDHHPPIPFDPLISNIEQRREDREWERAHFSIPSAPGAEAQPEWEDFMDAEDYINDEDRFNVTHRIQLLFPQIDISPSDGYISTDELTDWNLHQAVREVMHRSARDLETHDKDKDGFVSFQEYQAPIWTRRLEDDASDNTMGWWRENHFNAADVDGNGLLNLTEFNDFQHPADSSNPKLMQWLCKEEIRERDKDKDGKLSFQEYFQGLFDSIRNYDEDQNQTDSATDAPAKKLFQQLDKDNDGFISDEELLPVIGNLHPSERFYAKQQADYAISQADTDVDGRLSLEEMIEHPYVFYSAIFNDDEEEDGYHDEFR